MADDNPKKTSLIELLWWPLKAAAAWLWHFLKSPSFLILSMVVFGLSIIAWAFLLFDDHCGNDDGNALWCLVVSRNPPWVLLSGLATVPAVILTWYWKEKHKREDIRIARDGQVTDRFNRAIEQLGNDSQVAVRLGAIYALERIAKDSAKDHWTIVETLSAFLKTRVPLKDLVEDGEAQPHNGAQRVVALDVQAAVRVLARRRAVNEPTMIDLRWTDLTGAELPEARFAGVNLGGSILRRAILNRANLEAANLGGAKLEGAYLKGANLEGAHLRGARLRGVNFKGTNLRGANLERADLEGAILEGANLEQANLEQANLSKAYLEGAHLRGARLARACLAEAFLVATDLQGVDLQEVIGLSRVQLSFALLDLDSRLPAEFADLIPVVPSLTPSPARRRVFSVAWRWLHKGVGDEVTDSKEARDSPDRTSTD